MAGFGDLDGVYRVELGVAVFGESVFEFQPKVRGGGCGLRMVSGRRGLKTELMIFSFFRQSCLSEA